MGFFLAFFALFLLVLFIFTRFLAGIFCYFLHVGAQIGAQIGA
jgi:hypothetical protein